MAPKINLSGTRGGNKGMELMGERQKGASYSSREIRRKEGSRVCGKLNK